MTLCSFAFDTTFLLGFFEEKAKDDVRYHVASDTFLMKFTGGDRGMHPLAWQRIARCIPNNVTCWLQEKAACRVVARPTCLFTAGGRLRILNTSVCAACFFQTLQKFTDDLAAHVAHR